MKIAIAQLNYKVGDLRGNVDKNIAAIKKAHADKVDLIIFPELCITGYPPHDLVENRKFVEAAMEIEREMCNCIPETEKHIINVIFGNVFMSAGPKLHNQAIATIANAQPLKDCTYRFSKQLLPTYNVFDEWRNFEPGNHSGVYNCCGKKFGILICEDIWAELDSRYQNNPVEKFFREEGGVDCLISINASPSNHGKREQRRKLLSYTARKYNVPIIYVNQVGANDDLVFDGGSMVVAPVGGTTGIQICTIGGPFKEDYATFQFDNFIHGIGHTYDYEDEVRFRTPSYLNYEHTVLGIRDYVNKLGFPGVVVGCSGGIDSALVLALAIDALGADRVTAITMPSGYSSTGSVDDSAQLCKNLGVELFKHPIEKIFRTYLKGYGDSMPNIFYSGIAQENIQARIRGNILMEYSNSTSYLVLSTSNKSEASVGYTTLYGDMSGGLAPISDLYKTEVWALARYYNELHGKEVIPATIINKAPSAELKPDQKDTDSLPPYEILDKYLFDYIENGVMAVNDPIASRVYQLVDNSEFKRRQAPPTIRVHKIAFGAGRKLPIVKGKWK